MVVFIGNGKLHVSAYSGHHQVLTNFLLQLSHATHTPPNLASQTHVTDNDDEISTSTRGLCILYITLIARKMSKPDDIINNINI